MATKKLATVRTMPGHFANELRMKKWRIAHPVTPLPELPDGWKWATEQEIDECASFSDENMGEFTNDEPVYGVTFIKVRENAYRRIDSYDDYQYWIAPDDLDMQSMKRYYHAQGYSRQDSYLNAWRDIRRNYDLASSWGNTYNAYLLKVALIDPDGCEVDTEYLGGVSLDERTQAAYRESTAYVESEYENMKYEILSRVAPSADHMLAKAHQFASFAESIA